MLQGTSSDVGKSLIATLFCRLLIQDGIKVAPFKSQNMSNNSYVTIEGLEIGRAQGIQAEAAKTQPAVIMNPILLKPQNDQSSEVILFGKRHTSLNGMDYRDQFYEIGKEAIRTSLSHLNEKYEAIVIEGAGSPVEMNLQSRELVNMMVAEMADVPVILIADIDRGGVFASIVGTLALLSDTQRKRVKGIIINKFRGDRALFDDGVSWIEAHTSIPVLGVLPYVENHRIEQEDSLGVSMVSSSTKRGSDLFVAVVYLPYLSNFTDIESLVDEPGVHVKWVRHPEELSDNPDMLILPGTKSSIHSLRELKRLGWQDKMTDLQLAGVWLMGICGGYQMMGQMLHDPTGIDAGVPHEREQGFGFFPSKTIFQNEKKVKLRSGYILSEKQEPLVPVTGYEIHLGETIMDEHVSLRPFLQLENGREEGCWSTGRRLIGTYLHDIFRESHARSYLLNEIRRSIGKEEVEVQKIKLDVYDELAKNLKPHIKWDDIKTIMGLKDES